MKIKTNKSNSCQQFKEKIFFQFHLLLHITLNYLLNLLDLGMTIASNCYSSNVYLSFSLFQCTYVNILRVQKKI